MNAILESGLGPPPRIPRRPPGRARTGLARRTIDLCIAPGRFPRPIALGERAVGWIEVEVDAGLRPWIEASRREPEPLPRSGGQTRLIRPFGGFGNLSTEAEFHEARNRRLAVEVTWEPGETIGVMLEDGGAARESAAAGSDRHKPKWRHAMAEKFFWKRGKTPRRRFPANASQRRTMKNATEPRPNTLPGGHRCRPPGRVNAIGPGVWRHCGAGRIRPLSGPALEEGRANDQPNPEDYARRTLESATAALRREIPGPEIER